MSINTEKIYEYLSLFKLTDFEKSHPRRLGSFNDGGYVVLDIDLQKTDSLYSYGISKNIDFELDFCRRYDCNAYLYDHTIKKLPRKKKYLHFKRQGLGPKKTLDLDTLDNHINANGDNETKYLVLKIDIEGAEYDSLLAVSDRTLKCFSQIYIELHNVANIETPLEYEKKISFMKRLTTHFYIYHAHANNYAGIVNLGGFKIPRVLELTLVNRNISIKPKPFVKQLPLSVDNPCTWKSPELKLNFWPFAAETSQEQYEISRDKSRFNPMYLIKKIKYKIKKHMKTLELAR